MMSRLFAVAVVFALLAGEALAQNRAYYGTPRKATARHYSGIYQAQRPNVVPTFSLPAYGGGVFYGPRLRFARPVYYQPVVVQPVVIYPATTFGFGF